MLCFIVRDGATMVTYGAMSGKPSLNLASSAFLYKDLTLKGFSLSRCYSLTLSFLFLESVRQGHVHTSFNST